MIFTESDDESPYFQPSNGERFYIITPTLKKQKSSIQNLQISHSNFMFLNQDIYTVYDISTEKLISKGGFGEVFEIQTLDGSLTRAIKQIPMQQDGKMNIEVNLLIKKEIDNLKKLDHPNIVQIYEVYQTEQFIHIVMQHINGITLQDYASNNIIRQEELSKIFYQLLYALQYAHSNQIFHRDIKFENILVEMDLHRFLNIKLIDWGLSQNLEKPNKEICGTAVYLAPQLLITSNQNSCQVNEKSDIWSLGIVLLMHIERKPYFLSFKQILNKQIDFSSDVWTDKSDLLKDLLKKMLNRNPEQRISAEDALEHNWFKKFNPFFYGQINRIFIKEEKQYEQLLDDCRQELRLQKLSRIENKFTEVFKVKPLHRDQTIVIKRLNIEGFKQAEMVQYEEEILNLMNLDHSNSNKVIECIKTEKYLYIGESHVQGKQLGEYFIENKNLDQQYFAIIIYQILLVLQYAHCQQIFHKDLRPENILLLSNENSNPLITVINWGVTEQIINHNLKYEKSIIFAAPEIKISDKDAIRFSDQSDIWSLGLVMVQLILICLKEQDSFNSFLKDISIQSQIFDKVSKELQDLIEKMIQIDPQKRISCSSALNDPWFLKISPNLKNQNIEYKQDNDIEQTQQNIVFNINKISKINLLQQAILIYLGHNADENQREKLSIIFTQLDQNQDGRLSLEEIRSQFEIDPTNDQHKIERLFQLLDTDRSGQIDFTQFLAIGINHGNVTEEKLRFVFDKFDINKNGFIELREFIQIFNIEKDPKNQQVWKEMIREVDENQDGFISFDEFQNLFHKIMEDPIID